MVISRDVILVIGALLIHMLGGRIHPRPTWAGKVGHLLPDPHRADWRARALSSGCRCGASPGHLARPPSSPSSPACSTSCTACASSTPPTPSAEDGREDRPHPLRASWWPPCGRARRGRRRAWPPGDRILAINGQPLRDAIDFQFHARRRRADAHRRARRAAPARCPWCGAGPDLGLELAGAAARRDRHLRQQVRLLLHPPAAQGDAAEPLRQGRRLPALVPARQLHHAQRSRRGRARAHRRAAAVAPLRLRARDRPRAAPRLLGRPRHSAEILPRLERLAKAGIRMHAQIVLCPD